MKIKKTLLLLLSPFYCLFASADCADCESYKTQVANDCDSIVSSCDSAYYDCISAAGAAEQFAVYYASNTTESVFLTQAAEQAYRAAGTITTLKVFAQSIKSTAHALQCSTNNASGSCDCAPYLQSLSQQVSTINDNLISTLSRLDDISSALLDGDSSIADYAYDISNSNNELMYLLQDFLLFDGSSLQYTIGDFYDILSSITNKFSYNPTAYNSITYYRATANGNKPATVTQTNTSGYIYPYRRNNSDYKVASIFDAIYGGFYNEHYMLASLNNFSYTNLSLFSSIHNRLTDISQGVSEITNQFSIFIQASVGASPVLSAYTSQDGSYHDYLTNYYIQVSGSSVSGSTPLTNWFNRIEMLLAALVFQDDDGPNTNAVPSSSSYDQVEDSLNQTFTSINQQGQDFLSTVDTSGKSILSMLREWNSAVSGVAKPSAFTIAEIPSSFSGGEPDRRDGSSQDLKLTLDTDNELFSGFVELVRGVTTLSWITLFLVVGYFLSIRIISLIGKLISFGYSVYSAIFGGG